MIRLQTDILPGLTPVEVPDSVKNKAAAGMAELKNLSLDDFIQRMAEGAVNFAINLALAVFVFYVGRFVIRKIHSLLSKIFLSRKVDKSLATFVLSLINIVLYFILIVTVIGILGIETTSFLALFASAGVAIGMALSGTLQNFAGGVLILLLRPYRIGDYIEVQGYAGTVREIQIFFTILNTGDNKSISIPNGGISTGSVNNWSREKYRRISWTVGISYGDSVEDARYAILSMFADDERIADARKPHKIQIIGDVASEECDDDHPCGDVIEYHPVDEEEDTSDNIEPEDVESSTKESLSKGKSLWYKLMHRREMARAALKEREERRKEEIKQLTKEPDRSPRVYVDSLADSSVNLQVRAWVETKNYWDVYFYYNERFYNELPRRGLSFPFPQLDVHLPNLPK